MGQRRLAQAILFFLFFAAVQSKAQGQWVWMHGDNTPNQRSVYTTKGVFNPLNKPGARYAMGEWKDLQGNFWLYSGMYGYAINDLWKYNPQSNMWALIKGDTLPLAKAAVYGSRGVPANANTPGKRDFGAVTWTDKNGTLWLFGGSSPFGHMNDLWKYDIATNQWTWMHGSTVAYNGGFYGVKGLADPMNFPAARSETSCSWVDSNGDLWLFGGMGGDLWNGGIGYLNDLWKYTIATNEWTWMSGSKAVYTPGVYGVQGIASPGNMPGSRQAYACWIDAADNLWFFGGLGNDANGTSTSLNDLWKYDINADLWTWVNGSNVQSTFTDYGTICIEAPTNTPSARVETQTTWTDECGNFWMFGGAYIAAITGDDYNDLWRYNPVTNRWTWISGDNTSNQNAVYGTKGSPSVTNKPSSRFGSASWANKDGLWMFGGAKVPAVGTLPDALNDLWKYVPESPVAGFTYTPATSCKPLAVSFTNTSDPGCDEMKSYRWDFGDPLSGINNFSDNANPVHTYNTSGTYTIKLVATNCSGMKDSTTAQLIIHPDPPVTTMSDSSICIGDSILIIAGGAGAGGMYTWSVMGMPAFSSGSSIKVSPVTATTYIVRGEDANGCSAADTVAINVIPALNVNAGINQNICSGGNVQLNASGATSYTWLPAAGLSSSIIPNPLAAPTITTHYIVVGTTGNCSNSDSVTITVNPLPTVTFTGSDSGCAPLCVNFINTTPNIQTAHWSFGDGTTGITSNTLQHCYYNPGEYSVSLTITDNNGCSNSVTKVNLIGVYPNSQAAFSLNPQRTDILNSGIAFTDLSVGAIGWTWSFGDQLNSGSTQQHPYYIFQDTGKYEVQLIVINSYGCADTAEHKLYISPETAIYIPNTFTPDGDNINDFFFPKGVGQNWETFEMWIVDRWGNLIYQTDDINKPWNGGANGGVDIAQTDTYVWLIAVKDFEGIMHKYVGHVNLIR